MNAESNQEITIKLLKDRPDCIPVLASIWHDVLGKIWLPDISEDSIVKDLEFNLNSYSLPLTFVAFNGNIPVGMCSLCENDGIRPDFIYHNLSPECLGKIGWLADLVVSNISQKIGIGSKLIKEVINKARQMSLVKLYLFTFDKTLTRYYQRLGWSVIGVDKFKGRPVTVMSIDL